jgi:hypothetical protein
MVKQRQVLGLVGMAVAVLGAAAWFYHQYIPAAILWAGAGLIALRINKRHKKQRK